MQSGHGAADDPAGILTARIRDLLGEHERTKAPVLVALDGRSGAGKSTLAGAVGENVGGALVIDGDDFYRGGTDAMWDALTAGAKVERVIDWRRQRAVLECLGRRERAQWRPYDWEADDGRLGAPIAGGPADVVILEGAYSGRPELADLLTLRVLLELPRDVRRARLLQREGEQYRAEWEARWAEAEDVYFEVILPRQCFDLVIDGMGYER
jgi:uridine kinase